MIIKYNKLFCQTRQILAEQLAISRELTQKVKRTDSDEEEDENEENVEDKEDEKNEMLLKDKENSIKTESEIDDFIKLCRKYYDKKQKETEGKKIKKDRILDEIILEKEKDTSCYDEKNNTSQKNRNDIKSKLCSDENNSILQANTSNKLCGDKKSSTSHADTNDIKDKIRKRKKNKNSRSDYDAKNEHNNKKIKVQDINEILDSKKSKLKPKMKEVKKKCKINNKMEKQDEEEDEDYSPSLEFENPKRKPILDSPLEETTSRENSRQKDSDLMSLKTIEDNSTMQEPAGINHEVEIDPKKYVKIKPKFLKTQLPDMTTGGDEDSEEEEEAHKIISEAFADDDVVEEFRKEEEEEVCNQNF